jgi:ACT domain-containing protein
MSANVPNVPDAYTVSLELADKPGELLQVLGPIATYGGNLLSIFHERGDITPRGNIPVEVDIQCSPGQLESILSALQGSDIDVVRVAGGSNNPGMIVLLTGGSIVNNISNIISALTTLSIRVIDFSVTMPPNSSTEASCILHISGNSKGTSETIDSINKIAGNYDLHVISIIDQEVEK